MKLYVIILFICAINSLNAQKKYLSYKYLNKDIDTQYIFQTLFSKTKGFYYNRNDALKDADIASSFFRSDFRSEDDFKKSLINNIFQEKQIIFIDSSLIALLVHRYQLFYATSNLIGEPQYLRPDVSTNYIFSELESLNEDLSFQQRIWENLAHDTYMFWYDNYIHNDTAKAKKVEALKLNSKLDDLKQDILNGSVVVKKVIDNKTFDGHCKSLISLINNFQLTYLFERVSVNVTDTFLYDAYKISKFADSISSDIMTEKWGLQKAINKKNEKFLWDHEKYIIITLFSINLFVNFNTTYINEKKELFKSWQSEVKLDQLVRLSKISLEGNGYFIFSFEINHIDHIEDNMRLFLNKYQKNQRNSKKPALYEWFETRFFYKVSDFFRIPPNELSIEFGNETIVHEGNKTRVIFGECATCIMTERTRIFSEELNSNTSKLYNYLHFNKDRIENIIFDGILYYLDNRKIDRLNLQRIKVDDNEVIVWLNNVRKEILVNENYWENIQFRISSKKIGKNLELKLITDGEYATGIQIGALGNPPSYKSYRPVEPKFAKQLERYTADFLYKLKDILIK